MLPEIVVLACNWDGWSSVENASSRGLHYPASVRVVRVSCLSRLHAGLILKAFEFGADGVMLLGCEEGKCRFGADGEHTIGEYRKSQAILEMLGLCPGRLTLVRLPAFSGHDFVAELTQFLADIDRMPIPRRTRAPWLRPGRDVRTSMTSPL